MKKILLIIGSVLLLAALIVYFSYDYWLEKRLRFQLSEIISKDPNGLYKYEFDKLNIDLAGGSVNLTGIQIYPTKAALDSLMDKNNNIRFLAQIKLDEIELRSFDIKKFLQTNAIYVEALIVTKPIFTYYFHPHKEKEAKPRGLNNILSEKFKSAELGNLLLTEGKILLDNAADSVAALTLNNLNITLENVRIDSSTKERFIPFDYKNIDIRAESINIEISSDFYINSDSLHFNAETQSVVIKNFQINPKYTQDNFANVYPIQKQWFAITLNSLELRQINLRRFLKSGIVELSNIILDQPNIALYKDKSKPPPPFKKKLLPASAIKALPFKIDIDTISIKNGYLAIHETSNRTGLKSHLSLDTLNAEVINFTNIPGELEATSFMHFNASAAIYNKAATTINLKFDLLSENDEFTASGSVGTVNAVTFNPIIEPIMAVKATNGTINAMKFQFKAMDTLSIGTLDMEYSDIKIEVLNKDDVTKESKIGFLSFAANTLVKSNNIKTHSNYTQGFIYANRELQKDIWPFLWHSIQSGIISTMAPIATSKEIKTIQKQQKEELREK